MTDSAIRKALGFIETFRSELDPEIPSQLIVAFLHIALEPGISVLELDKKLGLSSGAASRNVARLTTVLSKGSGERGFGLVEYREDAQDRRRKELHLTPKGRKLLTSALEGGA